MARKYSIAEARSNFAAIVDDAEGGAEIEITRRGEPVAVVISRRELERLRGGRSNFAEAYTAFVQQYPLEEIGVEADFTAGLRGRGTGRKVSP